MGPAGLGQREGVREGVKEMHTFFKIHSLAEKLKWEGIYGSTHSERWI